MINLRIKICNWLLKNTGFHVQDSKKPFLPWPTCFSTVDMAVVDVEGRKILLGKKKNAKHWVIPGGFTDPSSRYDVEDAIRELEEETHLIFTPSDMEYIGDCSIDDVRYRETPNGIRTHLFITKVNASEINPIAGDDLEFVAWFNIDSLLESAVTEDSILSNNHLILLSMVVEHLKKG